MNKIRLVVIREIDDLHFWLTKVRRRIWNKGLKLWWSRLWIRRNEFHSSLKSDRSALMEMSEEERKAYIKDLERRQKIASERSRKREESRFF